MKFKSLATVAALGIIGVFGWMMAFFASTDAVTNKFVAGEPVEVSIVEDKYKDRQTIAFGQKIDKNPKVVNDKKTSAVVFMKVTIPTVTATSQKPINLISQTGSIEQTLTNNKVSVFEYLLNPTNTNKQTITDNNLKLNFEYDENWVYLSTLSGNGTYLFGYYQRLDANEETVTLFDAIQYKRILERDITAGTAERINIEAYAIQADHVELNGSELITKNDKGEKLDLSAYLTDLYTTYFS